MPLSVPVRIGDVIECSPLLSDNAHTLTLVRGRVVEVDPSTPTECVVQTSPYEPFQIVNLISTFYKVVYAVGEFTFLTTDMVGWELEITVTDSPLQVECGVIKQVDTELNCALLAFDDGHKDWRDLTMNEFKIVVNRPITPSVSPVNNHGNVQKTMPKLLVEKAINPSSALVVPADIPSIAVDSFDWFAEGSHVELCDLDGTFLEGALLCAKPTATQLQLYNEQRQFFEIHMLDQSFKVIIHGLLSVKSVPLGQAIEVYSPMHGDFRRGTVLKTAEVGKLTPVRLNDVGLEWLDLTSQTFKLVFLCNTSSHSTVLHEENLQVNEQDIQDHEINHLKLSDSNEDLSGSPSRGNRRHSTSQLPLLHINQSIELFDSSTKQYLKYHVTSVHETRNCYDLQLASSSTHSMMSMTNMTKQLTNVNLEYMKCRFTLAPKDWQWYCDTLQGQRVDIYEKSDRSILSGKIIDRSNDEDGNKCVHVKLKDGTKRWIDLRTTKVKLKFTGTKLYEKNSPTKTSGTDDISLWAQNMQEHNTFEKVHNNHEMRLVRLSSERLPTTTEDQGLPRIYSSPGIILSQHREEVSPSKVPSLDFSQLRIQDRHSFAAVREEKQSNIPPPATDLFEPTETALGDLLPPMDEVWLEEKAGDLDDETVRYLHMTSGAVTYILPTWVKKVDEQKNESWILNTSTGVRFQLPGSSHSTPQSTERIVQLPVGPIEAARVASQISNSTSNISDPIVVG